MSLIKDRYCAFFKIHYLNKNMWLKRIAAHRQKKNRSAFILQIWLQPISTAVTWLHIFWSATQPTCALVAHKIAAFSQQELIDWPSMETRCLTESKQTWKSRPAKSLVSPYHPLGRQSRISCICGQTRPPPLPRIARLLQNRASFVLYFPNLL